MEKKPRRTFITLERNKASSNKVYMIKATIKIMLRSRGYTMQKE